MFKALKKMVQDILFELNKKKLDVTSLGIDAKDSFKGE
jgi:hypothetical protein